jgi:hypothetical protein
VCGAEGGIYRVNTFVFNPLVCCFLYKAKGLSAPPRSNRSSFQKFVVQYIFSITRAFCIHGHNAHAAFACTAEEGCFSCDQMRRTPSNMSMISIDSISFAHSPSTRHTFSNMGPLFPLSSVMSLGIPPEVRISVRFSGNLAHSAKPPTVCVSTCTNKTRFSTGPLLFSPQALKQCFSISGLWTDARIQFNLCHLKNCTQHAINFTNIVKTSSLYISPHF